MSYGTEKWVCEKSALKRWGYRLFGELHVPGRIRANHILRELHHLGLANQPVRVLDAGCGRGDLANFLARRNPRWHVTGVELSEERAAIARQAARHLSLTNVDFQIANLEEMTVENTFDIIVSADVLEHIENDTIALANLFRALRPGGTLIITAPSVPQRAHLRLVRWRERRIGFHPSDYGHVRDGYGTGDVAEKFQRAGGEVRKAYFTFGLFGTLAFDVFFVIGDSRPNPVLFAVLFPLLVGLGCLDLWFRSSTGSAILAVGARRSGSNSYPPSEA
jgi:SAM-dependent methyltransferase